MRLAAIRGAVGFLSRLPVGQSEAAWEAFRKRPATFPLVGYLIGGLVASVFLLSGPEPTTALLFLLVLYAVTGINHLDGVADIGDAAVVHGTSTRRREVMKDTTIGVGGVLAVALVVFGLGTAAIGVAGLEREAALLVVTAEVGAKTAMALALCVGTPAHDGLGSSLAEFATARSAVPVLLFGAPAAVLTWPRIVPAVAALAAAGLVTVALLGWANRALGGISGDVLGATNELTRVAALHAGVVAWTLS